MLHRSDLVSPKKQLYLLLWVILKMNLEHQSKAERIPLWTAEDVSEPGTWTEPVINKNVGIPFFDEALNFNNI